MQRTRFRRLVQAAVEQIPPDLAERMENVELLVRTRPTPVERAAAALERGQILLGFYQGVPLTARGVWYGNTLPDRILIYQEAIEAICRTEEDVVEQVRRTVLHEIAHHFGIDDDRLDELGFA